MPFVAHEVPQAGELCGEVFDWRRLPERRGAGDECRGEEIPGEADSYDGSEAHQRNRPRRGRITQARSASYHQHGWRRKITRSIRRKGMTAYLASAAWGICILL